MSKHVPNVLTPFEPPYASREERRAHAAGLRSLADWLETTRFPIPSLCLRASDYNATIDVPSTWIDDQSFVERAGSAARLIGGRVDKGVVPYGTDFTLTRDFGGGVQVRYRINRDAVCEAKEVVVDEERFAPIDAEAESRLIDEITQLQRRIDDLPRETRMVSVTKTEYMCPDSLLAKPAEKIDDESVPF